MDTDERDCCAEEPSGKFTSATRTIVSAAAERRRINGVPFSVLSVGLELLTIDRLYPAVLPGPLRVNGVRSCILVLLFFVTTGSYFLLS